MSSTVESLSAVADRVTVSGELAAPKQPVAQLPVCPSREFRQSPVDTPHRTHHTNTTEKPTGDDGETRVRPSQFFRLPLTKFAR